MEAKREVSVMPDAVRFSGNERYAVVRPLGGGPVGTVYEVEDREEGHRLALKHMTRLSPPQLDRLERSFPKLSALVHPGLVRLHRLIRDNGHACVAMDLVPGEPLHEHVRNGTDRGTDGATPAPVDPGGLQRIRRTFPEMCRALGLLHREGLCHGGLKPTNVLVSPGGQVTLLDVALFPSMAFRFDTALSPWLDGTVPYLAPELLEGAAMAPSSDGYSVGILLYRALTGVFPYDGTFRRLLEGRRRKPARVAARLAKELPEALVELCHQLLDLDPSKRPSMSQVIGRLGLEATRARAALPGGEGPPPLVGREPHMEQLTALFQEVAAGRFRCAELVGESGMGKSTLVSAFLRRHQRTGDAVLLESRCRESSPLPYNAVTPAARTLADHLSQYSQAEAAALMPRHAGLLPRLFPVLSRVPAIAGAPGHRAAGPADQNVLRRLLFATFRSLLAGVAARRPVVFHVDDVGHADPDSMALLTALLHPTPPPNLLLVLSHDEAGRNGRRGALEALRRLAGSVTRVELGRLDGAHALRMARMRLTGRVPNPARWAGFVASETGGDPLLAELLTCYIASFKHLPRKARPERELTLDDCVLDARSLLSPGARRLLDAVVVAQVPLADFVLARAAALDGDGDAAIGQLRASRLVRTESTGRVLRLELAHERLRPILLAAMEAQALPAAHRALALALEATGDADPATLTHHLVLGGQPERARAHALTATRAALRALAFHRAADCLLRARGLFAKDRRWTGLTEELGQALGRAGRRNDAAQALLEVPEGEGGRLRRAGAAAAHLLAGRHFGRAVEVAETVLNHPDVPSATRTTALSTFLPGMTRRKRLLAEEPLLVSAGESASPAFGEMLAACHGALAPFLPEAARTWQSRHVHHALATRTPGDLSRALATEAASLAMAGEASAETLQALLQRATELAAVSERPLCRGTTRLAEGIVALQGSQWRVARKLCREAVATFAGECDGAWLELDRGLAFGLCATSYHGDLRSIVRELPAWMLDAADRGDEFGMACLSVSSRLPPELAYDRPDIALRRAEETAALLSQGSAGVIPFWGLRNAVTTCLYMGSPDRAEGLLEDAWPIIRKSVLLRMPFTRVEALVLRMKVALAAAWGNTAPRVAVRRAQSEVDTLAKEKGAWPEAEALLGRALLLLLKGDPDEARSHLREAETAFARLEMALEHAAARFVRGLILRGEEGGRLQEATLAGLRETRVAEPLRLLRALVPMPESMLSGA